MQGGAEKRSTAERGTPGAMPDSKFMLFDWSSTIAIAAVGNWMTSATIGTTHASPVSTHVTLTWPVA